MILLPLAVVAVVFLLVKRGSRRAAAPPASSPAAQSGGSFAALMAAVIAFCAALFFMFSYGARPAPAPKSVVIRQTVTEHVTAHPGGISGWQIVAVIGLVFLARLPQFRLGSRVLLALRQAWRCVLLVILRSTGRV